jgi:anti-sigma factor RsiW
MTTFNLTCEAVEATLADYLDETLEPWLRISIEEHLGECARCARLARELRNITRDVSALPALVPEREIWPRIAGRIGAPAGVAEPEAESEPFAPTPEPIDLASDVFLPIDEPPALTSEPLLEPDLLGDELSLSTRERLAEPLAPASEPLPPATEPLPAAIEPLPPSATTPPPRSAPVQVIADRRKKRWGPARMGLAAAAVVLVIAGTTSFLTVQWLGRARTPNVASGTGTQRPSTGSRRAGLGIRGPSAGREQVASDSSSPTPLPGQLGSALTVSAAGITPSPEDVVYDKEINTLQRIVRRQKSELDPSAVAVIEKNLRTLDSAIAQIRAALQKDPGSPLLGGQATRALEMKVELLRRAAMLRSNTI